MPLERSIPNAIQKRAGRVCLPLASGVIQELKRTQVRAPIQSSHGSVPRLYNSPPSAPPASANKAACLDASTLPSVRLWPAQGQPLN
jgi:hypothetical protein